MDLTGFISAVNRLKRSCPVFSEECRLRFFDHDNRRALVMWKCCNRTGQEGIVLLNKDTHGRQQVRIDSFARYLRTSGPLRCVSPENPLPHVEEPFHYELRPGEAVVLVTDPG